MLLGSKMGDLNLMAGHHIPFENIHKWNPCKAYVQVHTKNHAMLVVLVYVIIVCLLNPIESLLLTDKLFLAS